MQAHAMEATDGMANLPGAWRPKRETARMRQGTSHSRAGMMFQKNIALSSGEISSP